MDRLPHRFAEIDAADRTARAGADAAGLKRDGKGRPREFFLQPRGDETDDAGMPALRGRDDDRTLVLQPKRGQRLGFGLRFGHLFDHPAFAVEPVELGGDPCRFRNVAFQQQPHAEIGAPDPPAGIDARPQHEAEMPGFGRTVQPRHIHQRGVADMVAPAHRDQALGDEGAIEPDQRRDVGDGAERHMMQHAEQIRLRHFRRPESPRPQFAVDRDQRDQHEPDGREMTEAGEIVGPVRIHQRIDLGQHIAALMVIDHDDRHAELARFHQRLDAGGAAIDRHQQRRALACQHRAPLRRSARSPRKSGREYGSADRARNGANARPAAPPKWRHRHRNRRRSRPSRLARPHPRCVWRPPPSASRCRDRASVCGWSDRENPRPRRYRRRAPPSTRASISGN